MPITEPEILSRVLMMVGILACMSWAVLGMTLKVSRSAVLHFCAANCLVVVGDLIPVFRPDSVSYANFYQSFNYSHLMYLTGTMLFRSGMRELHGLPHTRFGALLLMGFGVGFALFVARTLGMHNLAIAGIYLVAAWYAFLGSYECDAVLRRNFSPFHRWMLLWPMLLAGVLYVLRALDDLVVLMRTPDDMRDTAVFMHFSFYLWTHLLIRLLVNASLIGQTLLVLIKQLNDQTQRLQNILDAAPVGVAVSTDGVIRFANPRVTELLNMKVGDPAAAALVVPEDRAKIVAEIKAHGVIADMEVQMYCQQGTPRDLLVTYMPTDYGGKPGVLAWMIDITERKKNEKRILFNQTVVENSEPMFWADPKTLTLVYANKAGLKLMELPAEKVIGAVVPPQFLLALSKENMPALMEKLRDAGRPMRFETRFVRSNSVAIDIDVSCYVAEDEQRSLLIASMRDITQQRRIERDVRQAGDELSAIFESATLGIAFIKDWVIVRANTRLEELFGWGPWEMLNQSPRIWYPDDDGMGDGPYADIQRGEIHYSTQPLKRKDGSTFWCRLSGSAIDAGDLSRGTVWMFDDVTEERKAAELMREAKELAEDATRMKSSFLANMSHEIRTPMNAIIGMSQLALLTDLTPKQRNYIEKVDSASRNLLGIINDILDFSKIEAGKMQFEKAEFHLEDVMENLADLSVIKAQDKGLELLFDVGADVPTALVGDPLRLGQVLLNLVGNAIKFTDQGEITVGIHVAGWGAGSPPGEVVLRFDIHDTGVGLNEEQRDKLFSAFAQADASTTRKYGGTGLGLTISKRLVELMDGQISVQSQVGAGSTFTFTGKFGLASGQRLRPELDEDVAGLRILVVDDNARAREIMLAILASQKFDATAVESGAEAMAALENAQSAGHPFGLVLMDWMMPGMDGLATIRGIRADPQLRSIPAFVMVTAHSQDDLLEEAGATRIDGILLKPVGPSALLDSILCALGKEVVTRGRKLQREQAHQAAAQSVRGAYLLVVDDNPVNQELAQEILQGAGVRVDVASNGADAVSMVDRFDYDGVLMDCQMPVMDGFEATRILRADGRFDSLPILAMTANAMSGDRELCLAAGMNDHIGKPIDVGQLFSSLARWVTPKDPQGNLAVVPTGQAPLRNVALPQVERLDLEQAMRRMGGNVKLLRKLIARFAETQADAMPRIAQAIEQGDLQGATREAHTTKGLAGNIGATQLLALAGAVESALRHQHLDALPQAMQAMGDELSLLLAEISHAMGTPDSLEASPAVPLVVDREQLAGELQQLAVLLGDDDSRAGKLIDSIAEQLRGVGQGAVSAQIKKLIAKYEFEEALERLRETALALGVSL